MKLRVRSLETKETLRVEVPDPCSLQQFKELISHSLPSFPISTTVHLSLNRKDELQAPSQQESLRSLGITSGDLIFYTQNPHAFSRPILPAPSQTLVSQPQTLETTQVRGLEMESLASDKVRDLDDRKEEGTQDFNTQEGVALDCTGTDEMDVDHGCDDMREKGFSVPSFLRKVLMEEVGDDDGGDHKLMVIAVHAVLLESGFVGFDPLSGATFQRFHLPDEWPSAAFTISLRYTLPELATRNSGVETVVLKFQNLGKFVNVNGFLDRSGSGLYRVYLDEYRFGPSINSVWKNNSSSNNVSSANKTSNASPESEAFEFWKIIKDGLALPLMINICESSGLGFPPCLMRLPTELKLKILEYLPGNSVAMMGCVCSEFRYLSTYNDLWKQKFVEKFGHSMTAHEGMSWKERFAMLWRARKETKASVAYGRFHGMPSRGFIPNPLFNVGSGGRYRRNIFPSPRQGDRLFHHNRGFLSFSPQCHLAEGEYESDA